MSRSISNSATVSVQKQTPNSPAPISSPAGHVLTVYADRAIFDETAGKFVLPEDVSGYNKF